MSEPLPSSPEVEPDLEPRIYVASLSDYNAGRLHGTWVEAAQPVEGLQNAVEAMLAASRQPGAEEWAIHDFEGFGSASLSEWESLEYVARLASGIREHGTAFAAWASHVGTDLDALEGFEEAYLGSWSSVLEYAEHILDELGATDALADVPSWLQSHVHLDVDGFARDLVLGGDVWVEHAADGVHVFDGHR